MLIAVSFISLISCMAPSTRSRAYVGSADHSGGVVNVGSDTALGVPQDFAVANNGTDAEKYLILEWTPVPEATGYRVYRAVYPHYLETGDLPEGTAFKLLTEISQPYPLPNKMTYHHHIPEVPLRRYQYRITALRDWGESHFSNPVTGYRKPIDNIEALRDMDYTIHFAQSQIEGFGQAFKNVIQPGRASGTYSYASGLKPLNEYTNYADFETILNGSPSMKVVGLSGANMDGSVKATGLYEATLTYNNLQGAVGGLTKGGSITIDYKGSPETFDWDRAKQFMKTVAATADEVHPMPPRREWDESDPNYVRSARRRAAK